MFEHLESLSVSFSVGEVNYIIGIVYRLHTSNNDDFMSDISQILHKAFTEFPNYFLYNE